MATLVIRPSTAATSGYFSIRDQGTLIGDGFSGAAEKATLQILSEEGNYVNVYEGGTQVALTGDDNVLSVIGPGTYKMTKTTTSGAASITLETR